MCVCCVLCLDTGSAARFWNLDSSRNYNFFLIWREEYIMGAYAGALCAHVVDCSAITPCNHLFKQQNLSRSNQLTPQQPPHLTSSPFPLTHPPILSTELASGKTPSQKEWVAANQQRHLPHTGTCVLCKLHCQSSLYAYEYHKQIEGAAPYILRDV